MHDRKKRVTFTRPACLLFARLCSNLLKYVFTLCSPKEATLCIFFVAQFAFIILLYYVAWSEID